MSEDATDADRSIVTDAIFSRGSIITSYAHIEHLLADICLQSWKTSEYAHLAGLFPYKTESRIKAVRSLLETAGPLKSYHGELEPVLDDLLTFEELRHFVAHGVMIVTATTPPGAQIEYRLFRTTKKGVQVGTIIMSASELEDVGFKISSSPSNAYNAQPLIF
jgi:hypothetical protein